jgi:hypothetical protein
MAVGVGMRAEGGLIRSIQMRLAQQAEVRVKSNFALKGDLEDTARMICPISGRFSSNW